MRMVISQQTNLIVKYEARRLTARRVIPLFCLLSCSQRVHGDQEEIQVPLLQLLRHAPVHPEETHAIPHGRTPLPLRDLREEVHAPGAHEAAHLGKEAPGGGVGWHRRWLVEIKDKRSCVSSRFCVLFSPLGLLGASEDFSSIFSPHLSKAQCFADCSSRANQHLLS